MQRRCRKDVPTLGQPPGRRHGVKPDQSVPPPIGNGHRVTPHGAQAAFGLYSRGKANESVPNQADRILKPGLSYSMKTSLPLQKFASLLVLTGAVALGGFAGGCASTPTSDSTGQYVDDTVITTKVKNALLADGAVKSSEISVKTVKGVVQLSGFVDNSDQKSAAGKDAAAIAGVTDVHNNLIVK